MSRPRRLAIHAHQLALVVVLAPALVLPGCGEDAPAGPAERADTAATEPASTEPPSTEPASTASIDGLPVDAAADALSADLAATLSAAETEFGDVGVDLLQLDPGSASLYFVDPDDPDRRQRAEWRNSSWSPPLDIPRTGPAAPLPLESVDPDVVRTAIVTAVAELEVNEARFSHVSVSPDESGQAEYLVALATATSLGRVILGPEGQVREVSQPLSR